MCIKSLFVFLVLALTFSFPVGAEPFFFGVSNSAFQVEGQPADSDWRQWTYTKGRISDGTNADRATDFWNPARYEEDFKLARDAGMNSFRLSIAWERIEPQKGVWDEKPLDHYVQMIAKMREYGLEPLVTLNHYVIPVWIRDAGDIRGAEFPKAFGQFAKRVVARLAASPANVKYFMTINEPNIQVRFGYLDGFFPPGLKNSTEALNALAGLVEAHVEAYRQIKTLNNPLLKVGFAHNWQVFRPLTQKDKALTRDVNHVFNEAFMDAVTKGKLVLKMKGAKTIEKNIALPEGKAAIDFLGIQNYGRSFVSPGKQPPFFVLTESNGTKNDLGWEIVPDALYESVKEASRYQLPIIITETGVADRADRFRSDYLRSNFKAIRRLLAEGVNLTGYVHWSLTDNFEWAFGLAPRFGLVEIEYPSLRRKPRPALETFRSLVSEFGMK